MTNQPKGRRKVKRNVPHGQVHIKATFNNTVITITDQSGAVLAWTSGGSVGFQGLPQVDAVRGSGCRGASRT